MNSKIKFTKTLLFYLCVYLVFSLSGVPYFSFQKEATIVIFIILGCIFFISDVKFDKKYFFVLFFIGVITFAQIVIFGTGSILNLFYLYIIISIPYFAIKIVGLSFFEKYVKITFIFGLISLFFYILQSLSSSFYYLTSTIADNLGTDPVAGEGFIIYTFEKAKALNGLMLRNPGPFWEPSAMGAFTFLALVYNTLMTKSLIDKYNVVFILVIITTFSTAAYVSLLTFFLVFFLGNSKRIWLIPFILVAFFYTVVSFDFLGDKVSYQMRVQLDKRNLGKSSGRFDGAYKSLIGFSRHPFFGRGIILPTSADIESDEAGAYGFFAIAMRLGLFGFIFYFFYFFKFWRRFAFFYGNTAKMGSLYGLTFMGVMFGISVYDSASYLVLIFATMSIPELMFPNAKNVKYM